MQIDASVDVRVDAGGRDPDSSSDTLRRYHRLLWSKPLPGGAQFDLEDVSPQDYLHHQSGLGEFWLSSDSIIQTYSYWPSMQPIISQLQEEDVAEFEYLGCTIGGMTLFPGNRIDGKPTINGARGMHPQIRDRFDLTLECVRRFYMGLPSANPLAKPLARYADFFALFGDFDGYAEFFLLQDLLDPTGQVRFFLPFDDFPSPVVPRDVEAYRDFRACSLDFVRARNARIQSWADANL